MQSDSTTAAVSDAIWLATGGPIRTTVSFYLIGAGVIGGLLAALPGKVDFFGSPCWAAGHHPRATFRPLRQLPV
jgi:uncharacterized membrane protein